MGVEIPETIAGRFAVEGRLVGLEPQAGGHINESWVGTWDGPGGQRRFLLQHVNRYVFRQPERVMENMGRVTRHIAARLARENASDRGRRVLTLVPTRDGDTHHRAGEEVWRLVVWIEGTHATERAVTPARAEGAARAFGRFLRQLSDLPEPALHETIPGFHDTPARLAHLERAVAADAAGRAGEARPEIDALLDRRDLGHALADRLAAGELAVRTTHNDAKIANVLFDGASGEPLCVVDLDTVMPGLALHDFGDMARSMVSLAPEDAADLEPVEARVPVFQALARGFAEACGDTLSRLERTLLPTAGRVITLEQAVRFLTDHLEGDPYYRTHRPGHNLDRARVQLRLLESLEAHDPELQRIADSL